MAPPMTSPQGSPHTSRCWSDLRPSRRIAQQSFCSAGGLFDDPARLVLNANAFRPLLRHPPVRPQITHCGEHGNQRDASCRQGIADTDRPFGKHLPLHQAVLFQLPKGPRQHAIEGLWQKAFQSGKPLRAGHKVKHQDRLPLAANHGDGGFHGTPRLIRWGITTYIHVRCYSSCRSHADWLVRS